jgi:hypothetical protein
MGPVTAALQAVGHRQGHPMVGVRTDLATGGRRGVTETDSHRTMVVVAGLAMGRLAMTALLMAVTTRALLMDWSRMICRHSPTTLDRAIRT